MQLHLSDKNTIFRDLTGPGMALEAKPTDVLRFLTVLRQHVLILVLLPIAVLAGTLAFVMIKDAQYEIDAQLVLQFGPELAPAPTATLSSDQQIQPQIKRVEDATSEVQILKDPALLRQVVEELGNSFFFPEYRPESLFQWVKYATRTVMRELSALYDEVLIQLKLRPRLTRLEKVSIALESSLQVEVIPKSEIIDVKIQFSSPAEGKVFLDKFVQAYFERRAKLYGRGPMGEFLTAEAAEARKSLASTRQSIADIRQSLGAWSVDEQRKLLLERRSKLEQRRTDLAVDLKGRKSEYAELWLELEHLPLTRTLSTTKQRNRVFDDLRLKQVELALQLDAIRARYGLGSRELTEAQQRLDSIEASLRQEPAERDWQQMEGVNATRQSLEERALRSQTEAAALEGQYEQVLTELEGTATELGRLSTAEVELDAMSRDLIRLDRRSQIVDLALDRAQISKAVATAKLSNVSILSKPESSLLPVWPRLTFLFLIAGALSVIVAVGGVLVSEFLLPRIRDNGDLAGLFPDSTVAAVPNLRQLQ